MIVTLTVIVVTVALFVFVFGVVPVIMVVVMLLPGADRSRPGRSDETHRCHQHASLEHVALLTGGCKRRSSSREVRLDDTTPHGTTHPRHGHAEAK